MNNILKKIAFIQNRNVTVCTSVQKCVVKSLILKKLKKIFSKDITFIKNVCVCIYVLFSFFGGIFNEYHGRPLLWDLKPTIHHQTPICTVISLLLFFFKYINFFVATVSALFSSKEGGVPVLNAQVLGVWWWIFGSRSVFKVTPEVFSWD